MQHQRRASELIKGGRGARGGGTEAEAEARIQLESTPLGHRLPGGSLWGRAEPVRSANKKEKQIRDKLYTNQSDARGKKSNQNGGIK